MPNNSNPAIISVDVSNVMKFKIWSCYPRRF